MSVSLPLRAAPAALALLGTAWGAGTASAASFALPEYSVRDLGVANAGSAALAEDASTVFANPAGLTRLPKAEAIIAAIGVLPQTEFRDAGSRSALGAPQTGREDSGYVGRAAAPSLFIAGPINDWLSLGLGITAPFGISVDYDRGWIGRYQATESTITAIDINPGVGIRLSPALSLGAGFSAQRADATLSNAVDFGAVCFGFVEPVAPGTCGGLGLIPGAADGFAEVEGTDWSFGWNVGLLFEPWAGTRLGIHYRSGMSHTLEGEGHFTVPGAAAPILPALGGAFSDAPIASTLELPGTLSVALHHALNPRVSLMGSLAWTRWSVLEEIRVRFANPAQPDVVERLDYKDAFRAAGGIRFQATDAFALSAGIAFDETPTRPALETARLPDEDRVVVAFGLSWQASPRLTAEFGYQHIKLDRLRIDRTGDFGDRLTGEFRGAADLVAASLTWTF